jgi:hypothetical protein
MKDFFLATLSKEGYPLYQLHLVSDGHGVCGHMISNFIIEKYPPILSALLVKNLTALGLLNQEEEDEDVEAPESDEDGSPTMGKRNRKVVRPPSGSRWDLKKKKQTIIKQALSDSF